MEILKYVQFVLHLNNNLMIKLLAILCLLFLIATLLTLAFSKCDLLADDDIKFIKKLLIQFIIKFCNTLFMILWLGFCAFYHKYGILLISILIFIGIELGKIIKESRKKKKSCNDLESQETMQKGI